MLNPYVEYFIVFPLFIARYSFRIALGLLLIDIFSRKILVKKMGAIGNYFIPGIVILGTLSMFIVNFLKHGVLFPLVLIGIYCFPILMLILERSITLIISLFKKERNG